MRKLESDESVTTVVPPRPGVSISEDGRTAVVQAGGRRDPNDMVRAADDLKDPLAELGSENVQINLTGAPGMWSDFNHANKTAMLKSEVISWPVTLAILLLAFGSLVAAGLPLMLTILGLVAAAGSLYLGHPAPRHLDLGHELRADVRAGPGDRLRALRRLAVPRRPVRLRTATPEEAIAVAMDTAGKAVLFSGLTVLISLSR